MSCGRTSDVIFNKVKITKEVQCFKKLFICFFARVSKQGNFGGCFSLKEAF